MKELWGVSSQLLEKILKSEREAKRASLFKKKIRATLVAQIEEAKSEVALRNIVRKISNLSNKEERLVLFRLRTLKALNLTLVGETTDEIIYTYWQGESENFRVSYRHYCGYTRGTEWVSVSLK